MHAFVRTYCPINESRAHDRARAHLLPIFDWAESKGESELPFALISRPLFRPIFLVVVSFCHVFGDNSSCSGSSRCNSNSSCGAVSDWLCVFSHLTVAAAATADNAPDRNGSSTHSCPTDSEAYPFLLPLLILFSPTLPTETICAVWCVYV